MSGDLEIGVGIRPTILVRYGEISLKGGNRHRFERALGERLREALDAVGLTDRQVRVRRAHGRFYVAPAALRAAADGAPSHGAGEAGHTPAALEREDWSSRALAAVTHVFGVVSASPAWRLPLDWDALTQAALVLGRRARDEGAATFKVEARRANKGFPRTSPQIAHDLGRVLAGELAWPVDVHRPQATVHVEVREDIYLYTATVPGPGGLPLGLGGSGALLLSGGIDSPVAGWLMAKRGLRPLAVYFHSPPYTGDKALEKVRDLARVLAAWCGPLELCTVPFTAISQRIFQDAPDALGTILMRRFMMRVSLALANEAGAGALVTGENLGQVASQTIDSMACIAELADRPVLRPLVGLDKAEIVALARRIGTYDISVRPFLDCCSVFVPRSPATHPRLDACRRAETHLPVAELVQEALAGTQRETVFPAEAAFLQGALPTVG